MSLPAWCTSTRGGSALLLVAPHGGRRPAVDAATPPPRLRVNDLHTPELTALLAARLDAATVINHQQDRNSVDLNRTSQVMRHAPWFLDLLAQQVDAILVRHPVAEVLFIHGWNVGQPKCDLGIGAVETSGSLHVPDGAACTVSSAYIRERITRLRAGGAAAGIGVSIGERYPASHRNNLLQLFGQHTVVADHPAARRLAAWAASGRINALQLELGIPLRWPGVWRDRLIDVLAATLLQREVVGIGEPLGTQHSTRDEVRSPSEAWLRDSKRLEWRSHAAPISLHGTKTSETGSLSDLAARSDQRERAREKTPGAGPGGLGLSTGPVALQFYDPAADLGLFAGIGPIGASVTGGRLLVFLGGQRIALFTGECVGSGHVAPLEFQVENGSTYLRFRGPLLRLEDASVYLDLEAALAQSQLVDAEAELRFVPMHRSGSAMQFGRVDGTLRIAGECRRIGTGAFANAGGLRASGARRQTMLAADFGDGCGLLVRSTDEPDRSLAVSFAGTERRELEPAAVAVSLDGNIYTPQRFGFTTAGQPALRAQPRSRLPILRPTGHGGYVRVTFGVARFEWGTRTGWGLYEHAVPIPDAGSREDGPRRAASPGPRENQP